MGAWLGDTPAALTSMVISPCLCPSWISPRIEVREDRSISMGITSKPAASMIPAARWAFSRDRSPTTMVLPYPTLRAMAMPIWPAPVHNSTSFFIRKHLLLNFTKSG